MAYARKLASGKYQGVYRDPGGKKRYAATMARKGDALRAAQDQERRVRSGSWTDPAGATVTVRNWSEHWLDVQTCSERTVADRREVLRTLVLPTWGDVEIGKVTLADVRKWISNLRGSRGQTLSPARVKRAHWVLSSMLALAVEDGRLSVNRAHDANGRAKFLPKGSTGRTRVFLTHDQLRRLADATDARYRPLVLVMGLTGLRPGEVLALRVGDFDMLRRRLSIRRAYTSVEGRVVLKSTKTGEAREVAFPRALVELLAAMMIGKARDDLVFPAPGGGPLEQANLRNRIIAPAVRAVAKVDQDFPANVTPYTLRHTAASLAVSAGANVKAVQRMLGHAKASMTLDVYSGLFEQDLDDVADRMDVGFAEARKGVATQ